MSDSAEQTSPEDDQPTAFLSDVEAGQSEKLIATQLDNLVIALGDVKSRIENILSEESDELGRWTLILAEIASSQTELAQAVSQSRSVLNEMESRIEKLLVVIDTSRKMLTDAMEKLVHF